jgi:hypothetical protein
MLDTKATKLGNISLPFAGQSLAIDTEMAFDALSNYLSDLALLNTGVTAKEIYKGRKESNVSTLISLDEGGNIQSAPFTSDNINARSGQFAHLKLSGVMRDRDWETCI